MTLTELIAVRHGESEGNLAREAAEADQSDDVTVDQRDADVPLSARGREQAQAVGRWLAAHAVEHELAAVWSSPYVRARQTADLALDLAGLPLPIRVDERLRDRELGVLDRLTGRGVMARFPDEAARSRRLGKLYYRPPGGESWVDVALRLRTFLADLDRDPHSGGVVLFCHDAVVMLVRYVLEGLDEERLLELAHARTVGNGSVTRLVRAADGWRLAAFDEQQHLAHAGTQATHHGRESEENGA